MRIFPPEPDVDMYNEGFGDTDILQRKQIGEALSDMLERIDDPLVIALDGEWGTGKTYFLKRWVGAHTEENGSGATTVYFDAFAHDYVSDPLPALVSALAERLPPKNKKTLETVKTAAFKLAKPLAKIGLSVATFGATEAAGELGDNIVEAISGETAGAIEKYWEKESDRREAMADFRSALEQIANDENSNDTGSSLVFVIDELDRCRPSYALEVLEVIKHFFSVPHVHFVLGVNLESLENSVKFSYGNDIKAQAYLKKFIQLKIELPDEVGNENMSRPANIVYLGNILAEMEIPRHIADKIHKTIRYVAKVNSVSIRDIRAIVSQVPLASEEFIGNDKYLSGWVDVFVDLLVVKSVRPDLYPNFLNATVSEEDLEAYIGANFDNINQEIGGEHNDNFDHFIFWKYATWLFLSGNSDLSEADPHFRGEVTKQFSVHGLYDDISKIPIRAHRRYIDRFSFYSSDAGKKS